MLAGERAGGKQQRPPKAGVCLHKNCDEGSERNNLAAAIVQGTSTRTTCPTPGVGGPKPMFET